MSESQKNSFHVNSIAFVSFRPAELKIGTQWLVIYYAKNPLTERMERFRISVPVLRSDTERKKLAKKLVVEVNNKLYNGWLPYYSDLKSNSFKTFDYCKTKFIEIIEKEVKDGVKRSDTLRSYNSFLNMITKYLKENTSVNLMLDFKKDIVVKYLDYIYYERNNTARTYNNHLDFINTFLNFCIERDYFKENFTTTIRRKQKEEKIRQVLTPTIKSKVKELQQTNSGYFTLCMATYFCFLRRTELTKLKVSDISLIDNCITIRSDQSKNKKTENITIPKTYALILKTHLLKANNNDYLFSANNFNTGQKQLQPKKISDQWNKFRTENEISNEFQFYSLKDTGITDLLRNGIAAIKVRDQARHYDLKITEKYTSRNKTFDTDVLNSEFDF